MYDNSSNNVDDWSSLAIRKISGVSDAGTFSLSSVCDTVYILPKFLFRTGKNSLHLNFMVIFL